MFREFVTKAERELVDRIIGKRIINRGELARLPAETSS